MASRRIKNVVGALAAVLLLASLIPHPPARGMSATALEIIDAVNALRASRGLTPYAIDAGIMAYAQEHSEYLASIHTGTHIHSDGKLPQEHGMQENVASGDIGIITPEIAVYQIWSDEGHMKTMVGFVGGSVGVGVAQDDTTEYFTLDVRPTGVVLQPPKGAGSPGSAAAATKTIPILPLVTMTQRANGCTVHEVGYGQSLWSIAIAYGVKIDAIRGFNNLPAGSTEIYAGQKLLIGCEAVTPTVAVTLIVSPTGVLPTHAEITSPTVVSTRVSARAELPTRPGDPGTEIFPAAKRGNSSPPAALMAGVLILAGGTLLVVLAFSLVKRQ